MQNLARIRSCLSPRWVLLALTVLSTLPILAQANGPIEIDASRSVLTVRVYKTGLFSAFAHNHEIRAPVQAGNFDELKRTIKFIVEAKQLRVLDPDASESERSQVQANMQGSEVLNVGKFPQIKFSSTSVEPNGAGKWTVHGNLTLHGQTRPVNVEVRGEKGHYTGSATLQQTDFGITPISIAGGSIKVKDEVRVEFEIFGK